MIRRPQRSTHCISSAASDVYKRQELDGTLICKLDPSQSVGSSGVSDMELVNMKGRIIGYDQEKKQVRIDHGFLFQETTDSNDQDLFLRKDQKQDSL